MTFKTSIKSADSINQILGMIGTLERNGIEPECGSKRFARDSTGILYYNAPAADCLDVYTPVCNPANSHFTTLTGLSY